MNKDDYITVKITAKAKGILRKQIQMSLHDFHCMEREYNNGKNPKVVNSCFISMDFEWEDKDVTDVQITTLEDK